MFRLSAFPAYRQLDQMDCGPTCLKIVADFYGKKYDLEYLRQLSLLQKEGASLEGLSGALDRIGISSLGIKAGIRQLVEEIPLPVIAHWEGNHFLVVYKVSGSKIYVSDPALGRMKYSHQEFMDKWVNFPTNEGILLLMEPKEIFFEKEMAEISSRSGFSFLISYLRPYSQLLNQVFIGLFIASIIQLMLPFLTQSLVDYGLNYENIGFVHLIVLAQLILFLTLCTTEVIRDWILLHLSTNINIQMISDFLNKMLELPISYFDSKSTGDLMQRVNDHQRINEFLSGRFLNVFFDLFTILIFGVVLNLFNNTVFLVFLIGTIIFLGWSLLFMKRKEVLDHQFFDLSRKDQSLFLQIFRAILEIKLNNSQERRKGEWEKNQLLLFRLKSKILFIDQAQINGGRFINEMTRILIIFWSAKAVLAGEITLGAMLAIQFIIGSLVVPVSGIVDFLVEFQKAILSVNRLAEIHGQRVKKTSEVVKKRGRRGDIQMKNVSFGFSENKSGKILKDLNLIIPYGKVTAIVGPSGSGKTTLLKLLLKVYNPGKGTIHVGGESLEFMNCDDWRRLCGAVLQEGIIFNDSLERNITESRSNLPVNPERLMKAIGMANLNNLIESLPIGLQTRVGEQGQMLSGGEKQRVLIARAIYKNPQYLFFDEATSSLDSVNEKMISENLLLFYKSRTVVLVAHRLSTVKNADQIIVMDKGEVMEQGTHIELLANRGFYSRLIDNQL